jgi:uncharacterized protein (TIGR03435 family)
MWFLRDLATRPAARAILGNTRAKDAPGAVEQPEFSRRFAPRPAAWALVTARIAFVCACLTGYLMAQPPSAGSSGATKAEDPGKPAFSFMTVKPSKPGSAISNSSFPLGPGDAYTPNGGYFAATNFPLVTYIAFAWKLLGNQLQALIAQAPPWASTERFDITARAGKDPGKDGMRLMMRSLLSDRFKLAVHNEMREVPAFGMILLKAGKTGPQLRAHPQKASCANTPQSGGEQDQSADKDGYPSICGSLIGMTPRAAGHLRLGARNVTMAFIASSLNQMSNLDRPVLDQTGLSGTWDFVLEWERDATAPASAGTDSHAVVSLPRFLQAIQDQLGVRLDPQKGSADFLVVDHVEHPAEN